jgi:hypothetical protein
MFVRNLEEQMKVKGKFLPKTAHESPEEEKR